MQFGSSPRVCTLGYVLLFTVFGTLTSFALAVRAITVRRWGTRQGQQIHVTRAIRRARQSRVTKTIFRYAIPSTNQQQPTQILRITVPGQPENQNNTPNNQNGNRTQQQQLQQLNARDSSSAGFPDRVSADGRQFD